MQIYGGKNVNDTSAMKQQYEIYTDLAVEAKESFPGDGGEIRGVVLAEDIREDASMKVTKVIILDEEGAKAMRKPIGTYITLESSLLLDEERESEELCAEVLAEYIKELLPRNWKSILAVGLGNSEMTADSLGPRAVSRLWISRHYKDNQEGLSGIVPGVMAQTGMETAEIVRGVVKETKPDAVIVIDALAARSTLRLGTTIQLTDTGIQPGSGVGNHRKGLNEEGLGVPVVAIGVPTVVGAATIAFDTLDAIVEVLANSKTTEGLSQTIRAFNEQEKYALMKELLEPKLGPMFVTPKDMDETVNRLGDILADGINIAVHSVEEDAI